MKHKGKILAAVVAVLALGAVAASYFGSVATVATMHATTNGIVVALGQHEASVVRTIPPSNMVAVMNTVILPRTNLAGLFVQGATPGKLSLGTNTQFVTLAASSDGGMLLINTNQVTINSTNGSVLVGDGSVGNPAIQSSVDADGTGTGIYFDTGVANEVGFVANGTKVAVASPNGLEVLGGLGLFSLSSGASITFPGTGNTLMSSGSAGANKDVVLATGISTSHRALWAGSATALTAATATTVFNVALANSKFMGVNCFITVTANDGTDFQSVSSEVSFDVVNKAGTLTIGAVNTRTNNVAASAGTLTAAYTAVAVGGNSVDVKVDAASSLTETTLSATVTVLSINSDGTSTITR